MALFNVFEEIELEHTHAMITSRVKSIIGPMEIVFPSQYGKLYTLEARALNIDLHPEELLDSEMLDEKVVRHVITLSACAEKAIVAIEAEDKVALHAVLVEAKALRDEIEALRKIVYEDALTKSYNRKWFEDLYLDPTGTALRAEGTIAIIDLNRFKEINDTFGHVVGDKVLTHVANKLKEIDGEVIRYGGDEFLVVFPPQITPDSVEEKIEAMLQRCNQKVFRINGQSFKVSFSYGITVFRPGSDLEAVIETADRKMYQQKRYRKMAS
ncbi:MAG: GGDEF domain-containing protein [Campylobacterales bacterium]|nr:GGDEF domain-containing protein [Campylobacterales bacterium]